MSIVRHGRYFSSYQDPILPSQCQEIWLEFNNPSYHGRPEDKTEESLTGKWLIYREPEAVDALWPQLKESTYAGRLGVDMKATTAANPGREGAGLICVYTEDWRDVDDIRRVLAELRRLGVTDRLYYKADAQTLRYESGSIYCSPRETTLELTKKGRVWYQEKGEELPEL